MTKRIHFAVPTNFDDQFVYDACRTVGWSYWPKNNLPAYLTLDPDKVTCKKCPHTKAFKEARRQ
jgi:hypothetical protein